MNGEERYNSFIACIDEWIKSSAIIDIKPREDVEKALNMNSSNFSSLDYNDCMSLSYELNCYCQYIDTLLAKQKVCLDWAEDSIWYIISDRLDQYGDKYTKWNEKYFRAVKENPLASQILKIKNTASARIKILEVKSENIKRTIDILLNLSKRK